jgi:ATP-dependent helicase/nuclease subunit B
MADEDGKMPTSMNVFIAALAGLCAGQPLAEKRLIAPSRRVGNQWLDVVARAGRAVLNVRVETLRSLAVELAAPALAQAGRAVAPRRAELILTDRALRTLLPEKLTYLRAAAPGAGLSATVLRSVVDLRLEGVPAARLRKGVLEDPAKAADLRLIVGEYDRLLAAEGLADYARVLQLAAERLASDPDALGPDTLVLIPEDLALKGLERRLLTALPPDRLRKLVVDPPGIPGRIGFSCAVGEVNEVRGVLRSCLEGGIPLDEAELLHTGQEYTRTLFETFAAIDRPGADPAGELPVTFAEGLPCSLSRPGRGLAGWLRWIAEGYPQAGLVAMVREGLLETGDPGDGSIGFSRLAALLRSIPIGQGRERYLVRVDERIAGVRARQEAADLEDASDVDEADGAPDEDPAARRERGERTLAALALLRGLVARLLELSPPPDAGGEDLVEAARRFLPTCTRKADRFDSFAAEKMREELDEMAHWLGRAGGGAAEPVRAWLEALPAETRVEGSGPRPGRLHVDHVRSGGHSGRPHTFIVGLDDRRFPPAGLQDPLLLDGERGRLDPGMATSARGVEEAVLGFTRLLGRLRGASTLWWPARSIVEDSESFPSQVVLDAFRSARGTPEADQSDLLRAAGPPASFAPEGPERSLDLGEWWLWRFTGEATVDNAAEILARRAPHLARGLDAAARRESSAFTAHDGRVPRAGADLDPTAPTGAVLSSNGLETVGACPRKFFYRYALGISPPEELVVDPERWLDPLAAGSLLHELFEQYVREIIATGWPADFNRGRALILGLLEKKLREYLAMHPSPSPAAFARERELLVLAAETLVRDEERQALATGSEPAYIEASLGMPPAGHGTGVDQTEPIRVRLPDGRSIRTRGRVDRIDRLGGGAGWAIWDYKTGGTWGYDRADPFPEGRKIQPYLYSRMVERRLRDAVDPQAAVLSFGYFFPGAKGRGERIAWDAVRLEAGGDVLATLCRIVASGAFAATSDADRDCRHCDYRGACGDVEAQARASIRKILAGDPLLEPLARLRDRSLSKAAGRREEEE